MERRGIAGHRFTSGSGLSLLVNPTQPEQFEEPRQARLGPTYWWERFRATWEVELPS